jgi:ribosomal protein S21|tara:strand:+ start:145 stop:411 length:267 start_codon:yes stop_codon:yes gene_type:complete
MSKHPKLVSVQVRNGNVQKALKIFKRRIDESGHLQLLRTKQQYTKPTTVRRKQKMEAIRAQNKLTMLEKIENGDKSIRLFTKKRKKRR